MTHKRRKQPRWFMPAVLAGMVVSVAGLAALGSVLYQPQHEPIVVGQRTFIIPPENVAELTRDPHLFIRIDSPGAHFEIVHDAVVHPSPSPHLVAIEGGDPTQVRHLRSGRSLVTCRSSLAPDSACSTWINYGGATWAVTFAESHVGDADAFVREATTLLRRYDSQSGRLVL